jgi:membrane-anchored mycosin MYCP
MEPVTGRIEQYFGNQLVVDLGDLELVERELDRLGVSFREPDQDHKDDRLRLALLELPSLGEEKTELERRAALNDKGVLDAKLDDKVRRASGRVKDQRKDDGLPPDPPDLDLLLAILRARFAHRYDHWTPTIGKNRRVELARGFPHLGGGLAGSSSGDPTAVPEPAKFRPDGSGQQAGRGIRIAVLDTKVLVRPFLLGKSIAPLSESLPGKPPFAMAGHGTFVAGLILLRAPGADLEVHPVLNERAVGDTWQAAKKLAEVAESGVQIINLSWGCYTDDGQAPLVLARAIEALSPDVVVVAAAGNHGDIRNENLVVFPEDQRLTPTTPSWPAAFDRVVAVGAGGADSALAPFTPRAPWVDVVAPGVDVESTYVTGDVLSERVEKKEGVVVPAEPKLLGGFDGFAKWSGTSFAAATVSGQLAADESPSNHAVSAQAEDDGIRPFALDDLN